MTHKVLLDTDIGSDIDDAVALSYLLKRRDCRLLGITTVSGEPHVRAALADAICIAAGRRDIPIHVGAEAPLKTAQRQPHAPQATALKGGWQHRTFENRDTALPFLRDTILAHPGEVTLLTIGPMTNAARLFTTAPECIPALKSVVCMAGAWNFHASEYGSEWNVACDPEAAQVVFGAGVRSIHAAGLDVTMQCRLPAAVCRERFHAAGGPLAPVSDMAEVWFKNATEITFHDPLAAAMLFNPGICSYTRGTVTVDGSDAPTAGKTHIAPDAAHGIHFVASGVHADQFFQEYFHTVERR